jgi:diguanylate cyclase (GGDEF)-like protein
MVQEDKLSAVLSEFARTMVTDFRIQGILDRLVERIVDVMPITGAGVTLISPGMAPHYVAASDEAALRFERLQTELGEGPCLTAYNTGEAVEVPDLASDERFPRFGPLAVREGMAAVFTFPLRHGDEPLGALDLYRDTPGGLTPQALAAAQTLADVVSAYLLNATAREETQEATARFRDIALHDALTGLPNRVLLQQRVAHAAQRAQRSHSTAAVLFADLDRFKNVNDTHGHSVGDELLIAVAARLSALVRPGDTLARVGGDEFVFLCEDLAHPRDVESLAQRIEDTFSTPFVLPHAELLVTASVGIAYAGPGNAVTHQLVLDADTAMYQAKRKGGATHQVIDLRAARQTHERNRLERDLRFAVQHRELDVAYQPIVRTTDGLLTGVETLLRWTHPSRGLVPAPEAIAAAEQSGLIATIGAWVLERGCRDWVDWRASHPDRPLELSVNIAAGQLMGPGLARTVARILDSTGVDPAAVVLEVTESVFVEDGDRALRVLSELKLLGVRLALDDFGTGYCSLNYLRRFPVDIVKIDRTFIADLGKDPAASAIVAAVTHLSHVLGLRVTAEGVETLDQRDQLLDLGCESAQGFLYAEPCTAAELSVLLDRDPGLALNLPGGRHPGRPHLQVADD